MLKSLTNKSERENGSFLEISVQSNAIDKKNLAHFDKNCPLDSEGKRNPMKDEKIFVQNQISCPKEYERGCNFSRL